MSSIFKSTFRGESLRLLEGHEFYQSIEKALSEKKGFQGFRVEYEKGRVEIEKLPGGGSKRTYYVPIDSNGSQEDGSLWIIDEFILTDPHSAQVSHERKIRFNKKVLPGESSDKNYQAWMSAERFLREKAEAPSVQVAVGFFKTMNQAYARPIEAKHQEIIKSNYQLGKANHEKQEAPTYIFSLAQNLFKESQLIFSPKHSKNHYTWIENAASQGEELSELVVSYVVDDKNDETQGHIWVHDRFSFYGEDQILTKVDRRFEVDKNTPQEEWAYWAQKIQTYYQESGEEIVLKDSLNPDLEAAKVLLDELKPQLHLSRQPKFSEKVQATVQEEKKPIHIPLQGLGGYTPRLSEILATQFNYYKPLQDLFLEEGVPFDLDALPLKIQVDREKGKTQLIFQYIFSPEDSLLRQEEHAMFPEQEGAILTEVFTIEKGEMTQLNRSVAYEGEDSTLKAITEHLHQTIKAKEALPQLQDKETREFVKALLPQLAGETLVDVDSVDELLLAQAGENSAHALEEWDPEARAILFQFEEAGYFDNLKYSLGLNLPFDVSDLDLKIGVEKTGKETKLKFYYKFQPTTYDGIERGYVAFSETFILKEGQLQPHVERKVHRVGPDPEGILSMAVSNIEFLDSQGYFPQGPDLSAKVDPNFPQDMRASMFVDAFIPVLVPEAIAPELLLVMNQKRMQLPQEEAQQTSDSALYLSVKQQLEGISLPEKIPPFRESAYLSQEAKNNLAAIVSMAGPLETLLSHPNTDPAFRRDLARILHQFKHAAIPQELALAEQGLQQLAQKHLEKAYRQSNEGALTLVSPKHASYGQFAVGVLKLLEGDPAAALKQAQNVPSHSLSRILTNVIEPLLQQKLNGECLILLEHIALNQVAKKGLESESWKNEIGRWWNGEADYDEKAQLKDVAVIFAKAKEKALTHPASDPLKVLAQLEDLSESQGALRDEMLEDPILKAANKIARQPDQQSRILEYYNLAAGVLVDEQLMGAAREIAQYLRLHLLPPSRALEGVKVFNHVKSSLLSFEANKEIQEKIVKQTEDEWQARIASDADLKDKQRWFELMAKNEAYSQYVQLKAQEAAQGNGESKSEKGAPAQLTQEEFKEWTALSKKLSEAYDAEFQKLNQPSLFSEQFGQIIEAYPSFLEQIKANQALDDHLLASLTEKLKTSPDLDIVSFLESYKAGDINAEAKEKIDIILSFLAPNSQIPLLAISQLSDREARLENYQLIWDEIWKQTMPPEAQGNPEIYIPPMPNLPEGAAQEALSFALELLNIEIKSQVASISQVVGAGISGLSGQVRSQLESQKLALQEKVTTQVQTEVLGDGKVLGNSVHGHRLQAFKIIMQILQQEALSHPKNTPYELLNLVTDEKLAEHIDFLKQNLPSDAGRVEEERKYDEVLSHAKALRKEMKEDTLLKDLSQVLAEKNSAKRLKGYLETLESKMGGTNFKLAFVKAFSDKVQNIEMLKQFSAQEEPPQAVIEKLQLEITQKDEAFDKMLADTQDLPEDLITLANEIFHSLKIPTQKQGETSETLSQEQPALEDLESLLKKFQEHSYWKGKSEQGEEAVEIEAQIAAGLLFEVNKLQSGEIFNPADQLIGLKQTDQQEIQLEGLEKDLAALEEALEGEEELDEETRKQKESSKDSLEGDIATLKQTLEQIRTQEKEGSWEDEVDALIMRLHGKAEGWDKVKYFASGVSHEMTRPTTLTAMLLGGLVGEVVQGYTTARLGTSGWAAVGGGAAGLGANVTTFTTTQELGDSFFHTSRDKWGTQYFKRLGTNALYFGSGHLAGAGMRYFGNFVGGGRLGSWAGTPVKMAELTSETNSFGRIHHAKVLADGTVPQMNLIGKGLVGTTHHLVAMPGSMVLAGYMAHQLGLAPESRWAWKDVNGVRNWNWTDQAIEAYAMYGQMLLTYKFAGDGASAVVGRNVPQWIADMGASSRVAGDTARLKATWKNPNISAPKIITEGAVVAEGPIYHWIYQVRDKLGIKKPTEYYDFQLQGDNLMIKQRELKPTEEAQGLPPEAILRVRSQEAEGEGVVIATDGVVLRSGEILESAQGSLVFGSTLAPRSAKSEMVSTTLGETKLVDPVKETKTEAEGGAALDPKLQASSEIKELGETSIVASEPTSSHPIAVEILATLAENSPAQQLALHQAMGRAKTAQDLVARLTKSGGAGPLLSQAVQWVLGGVMGLEVLPHAYRGKVLSLMQAEVARFGQHGWVEERLKPSERNLKYRDHSRLQEGTWQQRFEAIYKKYHTQVSTRSKKLKADKREDVKELSPEAKMAYMREVMELQAGVVPLEGVSRAYALGRQAELLQQRITQAKDVADLIKVLEQAQFYFNEIGGVSIAQLRGRLEGTFSEETTKEASAASTTYGATPPKTAEAVMLNPEVFPSTLGLRQKIRDLSAEQLRSEQPMTPEMGSAQRELVLLVNKYLGTKFSNAESAQAQRRLQSALDQADPRVHMLLMRHDLRAKTREFQEGVVLEAYFGSKNAREFATPEQAVEVLSLLGQAGLNKSVHLSVKKEGQGVQYWLVREASSSVPLAMTRAITQGRGSVKDALWTRAEVESFVAAHQGMSSGGVRLPSSLLVHPKGMAAMEWIPASAGNRPKVQIRFYVNLPKDHRQAEASQEAKNFNETYQQLRQLKIEGVDIEIKEVDSVAAFQEPSANARVSRKVPIHPLTWGDRAGSRLPRLPTWGRYNDWVVKREQARIARQEDAKKIEDSLKIAKEAERQQMEGIKHFIDSPVNWILDRFPLLFSPEGWSQGLQEQMEPKNTTEANPPIQTY